jgi:chitodextrinase
VAATVAVAILLTGGATAASLSACQTSGPAGGTYTATVCLTAPADGAVVSGATTVTATVTRTGTPTPPGVQRVVFYLDGVYQLTDYQSTYTWVLPTDRFVDGSHTLEVEALLRDGFTTSRSSISLQFQNGVTQPPVNTNTFTPTPGTAPAPGQPIVLAAVGDGAGGETSESDVVNLIQSWSPNLFLYLGDVYEKGSMPEFYNWYRPATLYGGLRSITDPAVGNHEYSSSPTAAGYFDYWDNVPHYYSFNAGSWHIVSLDSTSQFGQTQPGSAQYNWLASDLGANRQPCTLVYYHHPVFNIGQEGYYTAFNAVWALLAQHGVDIVLNGHDHTYQRWQPLDGTGAVSANGITELVAGTGGHSQGSFVTTDSRLAASATGFGALRLTLNQGGAGYSFVSTSRTVIDSGSIACHATTDTTAPSVPSGLAAVPASKTQVDLSWNPAADNVGVTGYDVFRDGALLTSLGPQTTYSDTSVSAGVTYSYQVRAKDAAGNVSALSTPAAATTPTTGTLFADGFESGDLSKWTTVNGLTVQQGQVFAGLWGAEATGNLTSAYAWKDLASTRSELYLQIHFKVLSQGANSIYLARLRAATGTPLVTLFLSSTGKLGYRNETTSVANTSTSTAAAGAWHTAQLHVLVNDASSTVEVWLDGARLDGISGTAALGSSPISRVELGTSVTNQVYDVAYDDVAYDANFIPDATPPSTPTHLAASAPSGSEVDLTWSPSTDDVGVVAYDVYRNGAKIGETNAATTTYKDTTVDPLTFYYYTVRARDAAGNVSPASDQASVTTPDVFADDFETGDLSRWSTVNGIATEQDNVFAGSFAARAASSGATAASSTAIFAKTVPSLEARVEFNLESQGANSVTLLRFRTGTAASLVSVFVSSTGKLGIRNDAVSPASTITSTIAVAFGVWHLLQLHATVGDPSSRVDVFLDGNEIPALSGPTTLGTSPIGRLELGESATNRTFSVAFDNLIADTTFSGDTTPPSAPTGLTGVAASGTEIDLDWTASDDDVGVAGYRIIRDGTPLADAPGTTYADTTTQPGETHTYEVRAFDAAGNLSDASNSVTVSSADTVPPTAPASLAATPASATRVDLSWTAATDNVGVDHYQIIRNGTAIADTAGAGTTYSDTTVVGTTTYTYTVRAVDAAGNVSAPSPPAVVTTPDGTPPTAPTALTATAAASPVRVNLAWNASTDNVGVHHYQIIRNGSAIADTAGAGTTYTDTTVAGSTTYTYTVKAVDAAGNVSAASAPATVTTGDATPPTAPGSLTATAASATRVNLSWTASTDNVGVHHYQIIRNGTAIANTTGAGTSYSDTTVVGATTYTYTVKAVDASGNISPASNSATVTTPDVTPPTAPTGLKVTGRSAGEIDLGWNASTDNLAVTGYSVFRNGVKLADVATTSYADKTVQQGVSYTYTVKAFDAAGNVSAASSSVAVVPDWTAPSAPANLRTTRVQKNKIDLAWNASSDNVRVTGYLVFRDGVQIADVSSTSYSDHSAPSGKTVVYTVKAYDAAGNTSAASNALSVAAP